MNGVGGYAGWRWIFIIEGIATVVVAVASYFLIYDSPEEASFLTDGERNWVYEQLRRDGAMTQRNEKFRWKFVTAAFTDWQVLVAMFMNLSLIGPIYGMLPLQKGLLVYFTGVQSDIFIPSNHY